MGKNVLICDDQQVFIEEFTERHGKHYRIDEENDAAALVGKLHDMKRLGRLPDLLMLDLYHPRVQGTDFEEKRAVAEQELAKLDKQMEITKVAVEVAWEPIGIQILKNIRKDAGLRDLPVIIYSQRGLFLLDDEKVRLLNENDGHWLLKRQYSAYTEKVVMDNVMSDCRKTGPLPRAWTAAIGIGIAAMVVTYYMFPPGSPPWHIAVGVFVATVANAISIYCDNSAKNQQR